MLVVHGQCDRVFHPADRSDVGAHHAGGVVAQLDPARGHDGQQALDHVGMLVDQVVLLARIGLQVVEADLLHVPLAHVQFPPAEAHRLDVAAQEVEEGPFLRRVAAVQEGSEVASVQRPVGGHVDPAPAGDRRVEVHGVGHVVQHPTARDPSRPAHDARHPLAALPRGAFRASQRSVAAASVTSQGPVVAGEDDHGVLVEAEGRQLPQDHVGRPVDAPHRRPVPAVAGLPDEPGLDVDGEVHIQVG